MRLSFLVYDIIIKVYAAIIQIAARFNPKARLWVAGRKDWHSQLQQAIPQTGADVWIHCASLGEFEQGRPVLEAFRQHYPEKFILLTFFSPSGYEVRKNYPIADYVCYLPLDSKTNARRFIAVVRPRITVFVKYEFWLHYLTALHEQHFPVLLISAIFRPEQIFFIWYGRAFRQLLTYYDRIFVQDQVSAGLLSQVGITQVTVSGDTRFDRVAAIAKAAGEIDGIAAFTQGKETWVAGSTWPPDEAVLKHIIAEVPKWIIAPHEIDNDHLSHLEKLFTGKTVRYSILKTNPGKYAQHEILLIDNVGMLSSLYRYGSVAYVGGGFGKGIHNVLEAAVGNIPVVFGPAYQKFKEARDLVERQAAFSVQDSTALQAVWTVLQQPSARLTAGKAAGDYVQEQTGATDKIMRYAAIKRFLIS